MIVSVDLTPAEEAQLRDAAQRAGVPVDEYARMRLLTAPTKLPARRKQATEPDIDAEIARLTAAAVAAAPASIRRPADPRQMLATIERWRKEDETDDPAELERRENELQTLKQEMNAERAANGERLLFL